MSVYKEVLNKKRTYIQATSENGDFPLHLTTTVRCPTFQKAIIKTKNKKKNMFQSRIKVTSEVPLKQLNKCFKVNKWNLNK